MTGRTDPPRLPIGPSNEQSSSLADGLIIAYLMLEGQGTHLQNNGSWGSVADLVVNEVEWTRQDSGLYGLRFKDTLSGASNTSIGKEIPPEWSYAVWGKTDSIDGNSNDIFSFRGPDQDNLRIWADAMGVWSWQKKQYADSYTALPSTDLPTTDSRMYIGTSMGIEYPPVQLRSSNGIQGKPEQPSKYRSVYEGAGVKSREVNAIHLGNNFENTATWKGTIGPFYFWDRSLTETEVEQLWRDPYAPFRRSSEQMLIPSTLTSYTEAPMRSTSQDDSGLVIRDDSTIFLFLSEQYGYLDIPEDELTARSYDPVEIFVTDNHNYGATQNISDQIIIPGSESQVPILINIQDNHSFSNLQQITDVVHGVAENNEIRIELAEDYSYSATHNILDQAMYPGTGSSPITLISISEGYQYSRLPEEGVTLLPQ